MLYFLRPLIVTLVFTLALPVSSMAQLRVKFSRNIEFLQFYHFLSEAGPHIEASKDTLELDGRRLTISQALNFSMMAYEEYKEYRGHPAVERALEAGKNNWFDIKTRLVIGLEEFPNAELNETVDEMTLRAFSESGDLDEGRELASTFLEALNELYTEVDFDQFLEKYSEYYKKAKEEVMTVLPPERLIPEMEAFYGKEFASYTLVPSMIQALTNAFGVKYPENGETHILNVFGGFRPKDLEKGDMGFSDAHMIEVYSIHEFGHSFANPVIDALPESFFSETEVLFEPVADKMRASNYGSWRTTLYEHLVHAGEVMVTRRLGNPAEAQQMETNFVEKDGYAYLPVFIEELETYESSGGVISYQQAVDRIAQRLQALAEEQAR